MVVGSHQGVPGSSPGARTNYHQLHPSSRGIPLLLSHLRSSRFHAVACTNPRFSYPYSHVSVREPQVLSYLLPILPASFSPCVSVRSSTWWSLWGRSGLGTRKSAPLRRPFSVSCLIEPLPNSEINYMLDA